MISYTGGWRRIDTGSGRGCLPTNSGDTTVEQRGISDEVVRHGTSKERFYGYPTNAILYDICTYDLPVHNQAATESALPGDNTESKTPIF
jgi:hypothetical protein